jgi:hypothetical protein
MDNELVILHKTRGTFLGLNESGARLFEYLKLPRSRQALFDFMLSRFEVSAETCNLDLDEFLRRALEQGIIVTETAPVTCEGAT